MTPDLLHDHLIPLYPPRRHQTASTPSQTCRRPTTRSTSSSTTKPITLPKDAILTALRRLQRGPAPDPFTDNVDVLKAYALHTTPSKPSTSSEQSPSPNQPYLPAFTKLMEIIANNNLPPAACKLFRAQYCLALHKSPTDPTKLRPIRIGYAYCQLAGSILVMATFGADFACILLPTGQFGVGVKGGMQYIIHSTLANLDTYIDIPHPTRAMTALDVVNMFNEVSCDAIQTELTNTPKLACLVPYFDLLYQQPNDCWIRGHNGTYHRFPQCKGVAQGCPMSSAFAALVLRCLMLSLNSDLLQRQRQAGRPQAIPNSYMDNTQPFLDHSDILWYLQEFHRRGRPLGIQLNFIKTKILTSISGRHLISPQPIEPTSTLLSTTSDPMATPNMNSFMAPASLASPLATKSLPTNSSRRQPTPSNMPLPSSALDSTMPRHKVPCFALALRHHSPTSSQPTSSTTRHPPTRLQLLNDTPRVAFSLKRNDENSVGSNQTWLTQSAQTFLTMISDISCTFELNKTNGLTYAKATREKPPTVIKTKTPVLAETPTPAATSTGVSDLTTPNPQVAALQQTIADLNTKIVEQNEMIITQNARMFALLEKFNIYDDSAPSPLQTQTPSSDKQPAALQPSTPQSDGKRQNSKQTPIGKKNLFPSKTKYGGGAHGSNDNTAMTDF